MVGLGQLIVECMYSRNACWKNHVQQKIVWGCIYKVRELESLNRTVQQKFHFVFCLLSCWCHRIRKTKLAMVLLTILPIEIDDIKGLYCAFTPISCSIITQVQAVFNAKLSLETKLPYYKLTIAIYVFPNVKYRL